MKIKYVQLESQAFFTDLDFVTMSPAERGVYCTLLLHLYCNGGKCRLDPGALGRLCNCEEFEEVWERIAKKFQTRKDVIRHKRVSRELQRAKRFTQHQRTAGLASAKKRQPRFSPGSTTATAAAEPTKRKGNEKEKESEELTNTNTSQLALSSSSSVRPVAGTHPPNFTLGITAGSASGVEGAESLGAIIERLGISAEAAAKADDMGAADQTLGLHFHQALISIIRPRTRSDRTCFRNVADWLTRRRAEGRFTDDTFTMALGFAKEAKTARNPAAAFMALLKKELRYPNG
ncbi:MAG: DUF1376 domain-containing protein [Sedimentisphaerales bacterium]|nr:DUF1376 domain-containing protein [Sedimentisphaerales bacterium]